MVVDGAKMYTLSFLRKDIIIVLNIVIIKSKDLKHQPLFAASNSVKIFQQV